LRWHGPRNKTNRSTWVTALALEETMATATVSLTKPILIAVIDLDQFALADLIWATLIGNSPLLGAM
jgi:hypothetical protein